MGSWAGHLEHGFIVLGWRQRGGFPWVNPISRGTAGAESLRIRIGNVVTPGEFIEPAEQSTGGIFMCLSMCVSADVYMYRLVLINGY